MTSFNPVERAEATERITVDGDDALVYHAQHIDDEKLQHIAEDIAAEYAEYEPPERDRMASSLLEDAPAIANEVHDLVDTEFTMRLEEREWADSDIVKGLFDTFTYFEHGEREWEMSNYDVDDPTTADIVGAYLSLVNAPICVNKLEDRVEDFVGGDTDAIFSPEYFEADVLRGLLLAFRDAHAHKAPKMAIQGVYFHESDEAIQDAVESALGVTLSDADLHGLLLADWNKSVCLQSASTYGKQKSVDEGMNALEDLAKAFDDE